MSRRDRRQSYVTQRSVSLVPSEWVAWRNAQAGPVLIRSRQDAKQFLEWNEILIHDGHMTRPPRCDLRVTTVGFHLRQHRGGICRRRHVTVVLAQHRLVALRGVLVLRARQTLPKRPKHSSACHLDIQASGTGRTCATASGASATSLRIRPSGLLSNATTPPACGVEVAKWLTIRGIVAASGDPGRRGRGVDLGRPSPCGVGVRYVVRTRSASQISRERGIALS